MVLSRFVLAILLWLKGSTHASEWNANIPQAVVGLTDSCVVIPCTYTFPNPQKPHKGFTGIWMSNKDIVYHTDTSKISSKFKGRTSLIGDLRHLNCSLKISSLRVGDQGSFFFRIEMKDYDKYTFKSSVSITLKDLPELPKISVNQVIVSQSPVSVKCTVSHSCPSNLPHVTWSHKGTETSQSQGLDHGQWTVTSSLTFTPSRNDQNKTLSCFAQFSGGKKSTGHVKLNVTYPPYNVSVVSSKSSVMENDWTDLNCFSHSNPPANSFLWFSPNGTLLANGHTITLKNVSRHTGPISCTAANVLGNGSSGQLKLNILYAPEIKKDSSCQSHGSASCVCVVESNPPSKVKWLTPNHSKTFQSSTIKEDGSLMTFILDKSSLQPLPESIQCIASNSQGDTSMILETQRSNSFIYIVVAASSAAVLIGVILACVVRKKSKRRSSQQSKMLMKATTAKSSKGNDNGTVDYDLAGKYTEECVYNNIVHDSRNTSDYSMDCEGIYANV